MERRRNFWNVKASFYHRMRCLPLVRHIFRSEIQNLRALILKSSIPYTKVLDIATGTGSSLSIIQKPCSVFGIDRSLNMLRRARGNFPMIAINGDAACLPFRDHTFPIILAIGLTEYLADKTCFFQEIIRVLHPAGYFLATVSQPNLLNCLRNLLGNRIHPMGKDQWETAVDKIGFNIVDKRKSLIQMQYLLQHRKTKIKLPSTVNQ
jgi:ubiquinone/menaquinone biosynthesis C-methylase UbiE